MAAASALAVATAAAAAAQGAAATCRPLNVGPHARAALHPEHTEPARWLGHTYTSHTLCAWEGMCLEAWGCCGQWTLRGGDETKHWCLQATSQWLVATGTADGPAAPPLSAATAALRGGRNAGRSSVRSVMTQAHGAAPLLKRQSAVPAAGHGERRLERGGGSAARAPEMRAGRSHGGGWAQCAARRRRRTHDSLAAAPDLLEAPEAEAKFCAQRPTPAIAGTLCAHAAHLTCAAVVSRLSFSH